MGTLVTFTFATGNKTGYPNISFQSNKNILAIPTFKYALNFQMVPT